MRIAVIGASGFVGSTLVERLLAERFGDVVPYIHSTGNAWRLSRLGIPLRTINLLDKGAVVTALRGCTHVVNCSRGGNDVMLKGLQNLLSACRKTGVSRLVHLSSVLVYGDPPSPESVNEDGRAEPKVGSYGWVKLEQDKLVASAAAEGLSSVVLCPPNISGVYSSNYIGAILNAVRRGQFALLDEGRAPCNVVDVCNLSWAIQLSLERGPRDGRRLFVTDDHATTWRDVLDGIRPLLDGDTKIPAITAAELAMLREDESAQRISLRRSLLHLVSGEVRGALRKDPLWAKVDQSIRGAVAMLGRRFEDRMRLSIEGPTSIARGRQRQQINVALCLQQLRGVTHSCARAKELIGYRPVYTFEQSMAAFRSWYRTMHGWDSPFAQLLKLI